MKKEKDYKKYNEDFKKLMESGTEVYNSVGEKLHVELDEVFEQCYKPGNRVREMLPKYWFLSNYGNNISMYGKKPLWLMKDEDNGRYSYHYMFYNEDGTSNLKNIELHNLLGIVFGSNSYGKAAELLEEKGVAAFGVKSKKNPVAQGHHKDGDKGNNVPENIEFVTGTVHDVIHAAPPVAASAEEAFKYLKRLGNVLDEEEPNKITVLLTDQTYNPKTGVWTEGAGRAIYATDKVFFTENAVKELNAIMGAIRGVMASENNASN